MRKHPKIAIATLSTLSAISIVSSARVYADDTTLRFGDLDLTSEAGKEALLRARGCDSMGERSGFGPWAISPRPSRAK